MAFLRVGIARVDPSRVDEIRKFAQEVSIPTIQKAPGLLHWVSGYDAATGQGYVCSTWETREQAEAGPERSQQAKLREMGYELVEAHVMEVVHEIQPQAARA